MLSGVPDTISCMGHLLGYTQVSVVDQDPVLQLDALAARRLRPVRRTLGANEARRWVKG